MAGAGKGERASSGCRPAMRVRHAADAGHAVGIGGRSRGGVTGLQAVPGGYAVGGTMRTPARAQHSHTALSPSLKGELPRAHPHAHSIRTRLSLRFFPQIFQKLFGAIAQKH